MRSALILALVFAVALLPPDVMACQPTTSTPTANSCSATTAEPCTYVVVDECIGCVSVWVYEETNHMPGLQRKDSTHDDTCGGIIDSDLIVS